MDLYKSLKSGLRFTTIGAPLLPGPAMKTTFAKKDTVRHDWFVLDATDKTLGRLASQVALRLRGKHKPIYTPHVDTGDCIIVVNAGKVRVTGNKEQAKQYHRHSGQPGHLHSTNLERVREIHPERLIENAVRGMMPRNSLGRAMLKKLHVYSGPEHNHQAQQPKPLELEA